MLQEQRITESSIPSIGGKTGIDDGLKNVIRANEATMLDACLAFFQRYLDLANAWQILNGIGQSAYGGFVGQTADLEKQVLHGVSAAKSNQCRIWQRFFHEVRRPEPFDQQRTQAGYPGSKGQTNSLQLIVEALSYVRWRTDQPWPYSQTSSHAPVLARRFTQRRL